MASPMRFDMSTSDGVRKTNRARVMRLIHDSPGVDRTELALSVGVSNAAITNIVNELLRVGLVREIDSQHSSGTRGRKRVGLQIDGTGGFVMGVNVLATNVSIVLADICGGVIDETDVNPTQLRNPDHTLSEIQKTADVVLERHAVPAERLFGVGFSFAGYLDSESRSLQRAPYLGWPSFDLKKRLRGIFGDIVTIENVTRCIALAENRFGVLSGINDMVLIRSALGLGGAVITAGQLLRGSQNFGGDMGHLLAVPEGTVCSCGKRGCLNTVASGWAVMHKLGTTSRSYETVNQFRTQNAQLDLLLDADNAEADAVARAMRDAGTALARHIMTTLQALNPEAVCLTGPLGRHDAYSQAFRSALTAMGLDSRIILASETEIITPAMASVYLALSDMVYSPQFNFSRISDVDRVEAASR
jgi:predicted NBD/HSP70 family sugar kinase